MWGPVRTTLPHLQSEAVTEDTSCLVSRRCMRLSAGGLMTSPSPDPRASLSQVLPPRLGSGCRPRRRPRKNQPLQGGGRALLPALVPAARREDRGGEAAPRACSLPGAPRWGHSAECSASLLSPALSSEHRGPTQRPAGPAAPIPGEAEAQTTLVSPWWQSHSLFIQT